MKVCDVCVCVFWIYLYINFNVLKVRGMSEKYPKMMQKFIFFSTLVIVFSINKLLCTCPHTCHIHLRVCIPLNWFCKPTANEIEWEMRQSFAVLGHNDNKLAATQTSMLVCLLWIVYLYFFLLSFRSSFHLSTNNAIKQHIIWIWTCMIVMCDVRMSCDVWCMKYILNKTKTNGTWQNF